MAESRLDMMISYIKKPCVLRLKLIRSKRVGEVLFIFEGDDDYDFYASAIKSCGFDKEYSHINGNGKEQSVLLYEELLTEGEESLKDIYFFVDQDYSDFCYRSKNIFTLPLYAIENFLSEERVIKHFIKSTFKLDEKDRDIIDEALSLYRVASRSFYDEIKNLSVHLYLSRLWMLGVDFPNNEEVFGLITKSSVEIKVKEIPEVSSRLLLSNLNDLSQHDVICLLKDDQITRCKYVFQFVRTWLIKMKKHINTRIELRNSNLALEKNESFKKIMKPLSKVQYDCSYISISKLSEGCRKIPELESFLYLL